MQILIIEPFFAGSHRQWALDYQRFSANDVQLLTLEGRHWKWRMHGGAISLAQRFNASTLAPDLILVTDMLDLAVFQALTRKRTANIPFSIYFHENQITYPWSSTDMDIPEKRDHHYGFINYTSILAADKAFYNSEYHLESFLTALSGFVDMFPDYREKQLIDAIRTKCEVLHLGLDLLRMERTPEVKQKVGHTPIILWNHRWEYDKNPEQFFQTLFELNERGIDFQLIVLGEKFRNSPHIFEEARVRLANTILHWGYTDSREEYVQWLWLADLIPVTSNQDFFGASIVEAMYCNVFPLLPKRLAYSEHVPISAVENVFYNENNFLERLEYALLNIESLRNNLIKAHVTRYDWSRMAVIYDAKFETMRVY